MKIEKFGNITLINGDCMEFMQSQSDKSFDLAIVDPPYGLGKRTVEGGGKNTQIRFISDLKRTNWDDEVPSKEYFEELKRVSKNEIIFGGNYFNLPHADVLLYGIKEFIFRLCHKLNLHIQHLIAPHDWLKYQVGISIDSTRRRNL